ncbi:hypothetical protein A5651_08650 [Mycobacterium sp. 1274761.0]|nr:hypothetical protein A5651_08650 [Mycobacterium sp. 1274761.0]
MPQQVPALVELHLQRTQTGMLLICTYLMPLQALPQLALLVDEFADTGQGVIFSCHESSVPAPTVGLNAIDA